MSLTAIRAHDRSHQLEVVRKGLTNTLHQAGRMVLATNEPLHRVRKETLRVLTEARLQWTAQFGADVVKEGFALAGLSEHFPKQHTSGQ